MKTILTILLSLLWLPLSAAEPAPQRTCRIIFPDKPNDAPSLIHLHIGDSPVKVTLPAKNFGNSIAVPDGEFLLSASHPDAPSDAPLPDGSPAIKSPAGGADFYLVVHSDPANKVLPIRLQCISTAKLAPGKTLWVNLTDLHIEADLGEIKTAIPPHQEVITEAPISKNGYYKTQFQQKEPDSDKLLLIMKKSWWHDSKSFYLGFITDTGTRTPHIFTIRDRATRD